MARVAADETVVEAPRRIPFASAQVSAEAREAVLRVLDSGWLTTGPEVAAFEREFAVAVDAAEAVAVSSCTAAIELSLRAMRLPPGSPVLTSTMTFCGAVHAIVHAGLRPVLVDVDPVTLMPTAEHTRAAAAGGAAAMVVTHYAGDPAPVEELAAAAGLTPRDVVEDAAHALMSSIDGRLVGSTSRATCFSFYATKNLPAGEGGMVTTQDAEIADEVRRTRLHGMSRDAWKRYLPGGGWRYVVERDGLKANMSDLQAALGRAHLRRIAEWQSRRAEIAATYRAMLGDIEGIDLPHEPDDGVHAWHLYVVRVGETFGCTRDDLITRLSERGVDCSVHFIPVHHHPVFASYVPPEGMPGADAGFERIVSLPLYPAMADDDVSYVCRQIADIGRSGRRG